ncbi:cytidine deaminase [Miltoncostaea marina]|uniref:cytidine deaminase n=1 Tax=Miltoncostaea marina TaxID=2843215 RepID=UPI001C3E83A2|nr:cytidine deaminase [Miltoncostaea marina]
MSAADLLASAREAAGRAHAPYSGVQVGAVVECADGSRFIGVNVESASYGLTVCAERAALARMVADGGAAPVRVAVARADGAPILPCGACRQVLAELAPGASLVHAGPAGPRERPLAELLPEPFVLGAP